VDVAEDVDAMIAAAEARGRQTLADEPRARSAHYDRASGRVSAELTNGCGFAFPARRARGLETARIAISPRSRCWGAASACNWERLDVDLSVPGLLAGLLGTKAWLDRQRALPATSAKVSQRGRGGALSGSRLF
jgi:hypothetical protein